MRLGRHSCYGLVGILSVFGNRESRFLAGLVRRIAYIRDGKGNAIAKQLQALLQTFGPEMPEAYRDETKKFLDSQSGFAERLRYAASCKAYRQSIKEDLAFRLLYLLGKYKI